MSFTEHLAKRKLATKGKEPEADVAEYLGDVHAHVLQFDWHRAYDARSAGGKFQRIAGDFSFYSPHGHGLIEVKEMKHDYRLPYKNYDFSKVAGAAKRRLAGGEVHVVIYSSTLEKWFYRPIEFFKHRDAAVGSWGLSGEAVSDLKTILNEVMKKHLQGYVP